MTVTDVRRVPNDAGDTRNGGTNGRSEAVTDTATGHDGTVAASVTCSGCRNPIPDHHAFVVCSAGRSIAAPFRPGDPWCVDCANDKKNAEWLLPWRRWGAWKAGRVRWDYVHRCARCDRPFYGAIKRRYCSDRCGELTRNARRQPRGRGIRPVRCGTCDKSFTSPRSDAAYCSSACRQKAYRRRRGGAT